MAVGGQTDRRSLDVRGPGAARSLRACVCMTDFRGARASVCFTMNRDTWHGANDVLGADPNAEIIQSKLLGGSE